MRERAAVKGRSWPAGTFRSAYSDAAYSDVADFEDAYFVGARGSARGRERRVPFSFLTSCSGKTRLDSRRWAAIARRAATGSRRFRARRTLVWAAIPWETASGVLWLSNIPFTMKGEARGARASAAAG